MKTALVIMAAGMGSRFGGGIKQLTGVGPKGELIIDYSIHDAVKAGFDEIIFIIRRDIEKAFRQVIGDRIERTLSACRVGVKYVYQSLDALPAGCTASVERAKPWGTGQAVLCCREAIEGPFCVVNADDYYGQEAFKLIHAHLTDRRNAGTWCMAGFRLGHTLSDNGTVTRGLCRVDDKNLLSCIVETRNIARSGGLPVVDGRVLDKDMPVSMNMWGFGPEILDALEDGFSAFLKDDKADLTRDEFLLPVFIGQLLKEGRARVKVLPTEDQWFGVTYAEDRDAVVRALGRLTEEGRYAPDLFSDLPGMAKA